MAQRRLQHQVEGQLSTEVAASRPMDEALQHVVSRLYTAGVDRPATEFQGWALRQLQLVIPHDAAVWGMGNGERGRFHNVKVFGVDQGFADALQQWLPQNPIFPVLAERLGRPVDMTEVWPDARLHASDIYQQCFRPFRIERILSSGHVDARCGLHTLLSLYRFDRERRFSQLDRQRFEVAAFHLIAAYSHAYFLHLARPMSERSERPAAVVDPEGYLREAQAEFVALLERHYPQWRGHRLPFPLPEDDRPRCEGGLWRQRQALGDVFVLRVWRETPLDRLTSRERQVVLAVCRGLSHKEVGRELGLAPTTVSSHLYRAYAKLGVGSRSALARLVHGEAGGGEHAGP